MIIRNSEMGALEKGYLHKFVRNLFPICVQICAQFCAPFLSKRRRGKTCAKFAQKFAQCPLRERPLFGISEVCTAACISKWDLHSDLSPKFSAKFPQNFRSLRWRSRTKFLKNVHNFRKICAKFPQLLEVQFAVRGVGRSVFLSVWCSSTVS